MNDFARGLIVSNKCVCVSYLFSRTLLCDKSKNTVNYGMHVILFLPSSRVNCCRCSLRHFIISSEPAAKHIVVDIQHKFHCCVAPSGFRGSTHFVFSNHEE